MYRLIESARRGLDTQERPLAPRLSRFVPGLPFAILLVQNFVIFAGHYLWDTGFPWDFGQTYYGVIAFWTAAVERGILPEWIPFQSMGYPFALQLQSGLYYPPLWLFPLLHIPYTLHAAVVLQCLHVFLGAVGMYFFLRVFQKNASFALIGAFAFQFFGGFYSNAEHPDIIRAFALAPWLLYALTLNDDPKRGLPRRVLLLPVILYLLAAGGYTGNLISSLFIAGLYVAAQLGGSARRGMTIRQLLLAATGVGGLTLIGILMAAMPLGPAFVYRDLMIRYNELQDMKTFGFGLADLPALFLSNKTAPGEISMTSAYVTLPVLVLAALAPLERLKRYWTLALIGLVALLMAPGQDSFFWSVVTGLVAPLRLSRLPSSDYRVFIAIPLILFSLFGLQAITERGLSWRNALTRVTAAFLALGAGVYVACAGKWNESVSLVVLVALATCLLLFLLWRRRAGMSWIVVASFIVLLSIDGTRVLPDIPTWQVPDISSSYQKRGWPYEANGKLVTYSIFDQLPSSRPARKLVPNHQFDWGGYIDGRYMLEEKGGSVGLLQAASLIRSDRKLEQYMLMPWSPLLLDAQGVTAGADQVRLANFDPVRDLGNKAADPVDYVQQTLYGINNITYQVSLAEPRLFIENEVYFPGWDAELIYPGKNVQIQAVSVNNSLRGWLLPAGAYQMIASYELPNWQIYRLVSFLALGAWLAVVGIWIAGKRTRISRR